MKCTVLDNREVVCEFREIDPGIVFFLENEDRPYMKIDQHEIIREFREDTINAVDFDGDTYYLEDYDKVIPAKNYKFEIQRG